MTNHHADDELILLHYGELRTDHTCDECEARLARLRDVLALADADAVPEPPADYEERMWKRVEFQTRRRSVRWWIPAAAAAMLVIGFISGQLFQRWQVPAAPQEAVRATAAEVRKPATPESKLVLAANEHLDRSSRVLLEVSNGGKAGEDLVAANRLYRVMAQQSGAKEVAGLLDELEPILLELAHAESEADLAAIRKRIDERELLFKLRVARVPRDGNQS
jgi:hypothetical protein